MPSTLINVKLGKTEWKNRPIQGSSGLNDLRVKPVVCVCALGEFRTMSGQLEYCVVLPDSLNNGHQSPTAAQGEAQAVYIALIVV